MSAGFAPELEVRSSFGQLRTASRECQVDRILERKCGSGGKLGREELWAERGFEPCECLPLHEF